MLSNNYILYFAKYMLTRYLTWSSQEAYEAGRENTITLGDFF